MIAFVFVGCQKENIRPNNERNSEIIHSTDDNHCDDTNTRAMNPDNNGGSDTNNDVTGGKITDPNNDEDEDDKTKR